jgi:hypothetical protein
MILPLSPAEDKNRHGFPIFSSLRASAGACQSMPLAALCSHLFTIGRTRVTPLVSRADFGADRPVPYLKPGFRRF